MKGGEIKTNHRRDSFRFRESDFFTKSLREEFLRKTTERAYALGMVVTSITFLAGILTVIICASVGVISVDAAFGWALFGLFLCPFIGSVCGLTYYVVSSWNDL